MAINQAQLAVYLTQLYLRLNGYFTTGFIVPASTKAEGQKTDVDCLAVRHIYHSQPERKVECDDFLGIDSEALIDLLFCEIKSGKTIDDFNERVRKDVSIVESTLRWAGLLPDERIAGVSADLHAFIQQKLPLDDARAGLIVDGKHGKFSLRALLCYPFAQKSPDFWCLTGSEIIEFVDRCFIKDPDTPRPDCSTIYDYTLWGAEFEPIARYIKEIRKEDEDTAQTLAGMMRSFK